ncbi:hypothetical protein [Tunicatimonas pelagia]|uniref:hypothetical protein n=1 Tax=Tunicatimonas pelagia TaxID=931531 RepID=UPI00266642F1|nr:hypothetical protein [Tunicatimonas pelagia]WKN41085.1 hypothetical protein P0M28_18795 [Tunicatimonas pelagia]
MKILPDYQRLTIQYPSTIIVKRLIGISRTIDLDNDLAYWEEKLRINRGQRSRILLLNSTKGYVTYSDSNNLEKYERLYHLLKNRCPALEAR